MIRLGLRLTLGSGREAAWRVLVVAAAVAFGVGLLLVALAGINGLNAQTGRGAWLDTSTQTLPSTSAGSTSRLWWLLSVDEFGDGTAAAPMIPTWRPGNRSPSSLAGTDLSTFVRAGEA